MEGLRRQDLAVLDGAAQCLLPPFSTLALLTSLMLAIHTVFPAVGPQWLRYAWLAVLLLLAAYPFFGLLLERAPIRAYLAIATGPVFVLWRTWLSIRSRFLGKRVTWVRTQHGGTR